MLERGFLNPLYLYPTLIDSVQIEPLSIDTIESSPIAEGIGNFIGMLQSQNDALHTMFLEHLLENNLSWALPALLLFVGGAIISLLWVHRGEGTVLRVLAGSVEGQTCRARARGRIHGLTSRGGSYLACIVEVDRVRRGAYDTDLGRE